MSQIALVNTAATSIAPQEIASVVIGKMQMKFIKRLINSNEYRLLLNDQVFRSSRW